MKLYYSPGACSMAAHIVLEWTGKPYEAVAVDLHNLPAEFAAINPAGAVPALVEDDGPALTQCAAVLNYLALTNPQLDLLDDSSPRSAAELIRWTSFVTGDLHPAFWPVFAPMRYTTSTSDADLDAVKQAGLAMVRTKLGLLDDQLGDKDWIVGGKRTIVDAYVTPMLRWAAAMLPEGLEPFTSLLSHSERMRSDPAVAKVMKDEGLDLD